MDSNFLEAVIIVYLMRRFLSQRSVLGSALAKGSTETSSSHASTTNGNIRILSEGSRGAFSSPSSLDPSTSGVSNGRGVGFAARGLHTSRAPHNAMSNKDYYDILEVPRTATEDEIKKNYYRLAKKYHPDSNKEDPKAHEKFNELRKAYDTLRVRSMTFPLF